MTLTEATIYVVTSKLWENHIMESSKLKGNITSLYIFTNPSTRAGYDTRSIF